MSTEPNKGDIVERCKRTASAMSRTSPDSGIDICHITTVNEAAAEIRALREQVASAHEALKQMPTEPFRTMGEREIPLSERIANAAGSWAVELKDMDSLRSQVAALTAERDRKRCPCEFGSPCSDNCSCAHPLLSGGCRRCCRFGSREQQEGTAAGIIAAERRRDEQLAAVTAQRDAMEEANGKMVTTLLAVAGFHATGTTPRRLIDVTLNENRAALSANRSEIPKGSAALNPKQGAGQ